VKALGIIRRIDDLGRIVIPKEIRTHLGIADGDNQPFEMFMDGSDIVIKVYRPDCVLCGNEATTEVHNKNLCPSCIAEIKKLA